MDTVVVGGGLAGLVAAHTLVSRGVTVTVLEATPGFGGQVRTERADGFLIEHGAEGFPARREATRALCASLGIADQLVAQRTHRAFFLRNGQLEDRGDSPVARLLGIQVDPSDFGAGLVTLTGGLGTLVGTLVDWLRRSATLVSEWPVERLERSPHGWLLHGLDRPPHPAGAVVLALPAPRSATLLAPFTGPLPALAGVPHATSVTVSLAFQRAAVGHRLNASGLVAANAEREGLLACVFCSSKFPGRAPPEAVLVRVFFRPEAGSTDASDEDWTARATRAIERPLQLAGKPIRAWVSRWPDALPRYPTDHADAIIALRARLAALGGIELAGAGVAGAGVDGAVRSGTAAARRLLGQLAGPTSRPRSLHRRQDRD